jgi:hypothetical protein
VRIRALFAVSLAVLACVATPQTGASAQAKPSPHLERGEPIPLAMPIRKVMNAIIDYWAFGVLFLSESKGALNDNDWRSLELASLNLTIAATAITVPGTGANDAAWVADPDWRKWAAEMQEAGAMLDTAVQQRNRSALSASANRLADACLACHKAFKPKRANQLAQDR